MKKTFLLAIYTFVTKQYNLMFESLIKKYKITQIEIDVLAFLANNPEYKYAQDIVNIRGISKAHVSCALEKLVKKGLIERRVDENNRRCNCLYVTQKANDLVNEIRAVQHRYDEIAFQGISDEDMGLYRKVSTQIYENLGGNSDE